MLKLIRFLIPSILAFSFALPATAQSEPSEALIEDASVYAEMYHLDLDEAIRRLELQRAVGDLDGLLSHEEQGTYGGLFIEHQPEFRVVVQFADPHGEERLKPRIADGPLAGKVTVRQVARSLDELEAQQAAARHLAGQVEIPVDSDINVHDNRVEVYAVDADGFGSRLAASALQLPDSVTVVPVDQLAILDQVTLTGGATLTGCTGGFTVRRNSNGELGISTAAHCGNTQRFNGTVLPFRAEDQSGNQDVQWHSACGLFDVSNDFQTGIGLRACTGTQHRDNQAIGSFVCKWGMTTGRTCGNIQSKNYAPSYVTNAASTFIRVDGTNLRAGGDSGGPWFVEHLAYGTHSGSPGGDPDDALYMPINYISSLGVSVLTFDPGPGCNLPPNAFFTWTNFGLRVDFNASGSSDPDGTIVSYQWDFGDGGTRTTTSPTTTYWYPYESDFFVQLTVTDNDGNSDSYFDFVSLCENQDQCDCDEFSPCIE